MKPWASPLLGLAGQPHGLRLPLRPPLITALLLLAGCAAAQQVSIEGAVRVEGLWCFPLAFDARKYVYIPQTARLGFDDSSKPQFSFLRYALPAAGGEAETSPAGSSSITRARGGGILHFLVLYDTPAQLVEKAQRELPKLLKDDKVELTGPIVFQAGSYGLVSSIINPSGATERKLLATGRAPVLAGNQVALSFDLTAEQANLLMASLQMDTPDVSIVFDMSFIGISKSYDAELTVDWSEVRRTKSLSAGGSIYFVSADIEMMFDEMLRNNAIKLKTAGDDAGTEGLLNAVYSKLLDLMFRRVEPDRVPQSQRGGLNDAISALTNPRSGLLSSRNTTRFGLYAGYQLKDIRSEGKSVMNFSHSSALERHTFITFNIGDLYKRYGQDNAYFRAVTADDPIFEQREIYVLLDGAVLSDFEKYINSVTVTLRRQHASGEPTIREVVLDRDRAAKSAGARLVYSRGGDTAPEWLTYDVQVNWSFRNGGAYRSPWEPASGGTITVTPPYERRLVEVSGALENLRPKGVRAVVVEVEHDFFGSRRRQQAVVRLDQRLPPAFELTLPRNEFNYDFTITWLLDGDRRIVKRGRDSAGVMFIDELPPA